MLLNNYWTRSLIPCTSFLQQIHFDLNAFKESVRVEFETVGLRITETEKKAAETMTRLEELEREMGKMRAPARQEIGNSRFLSMVVGNIPDVSSLEEAKAWLNKHCVKCGLTPPELHGCVHERFVFQLDLRQVPK